MLLLRSFFLLAAAAGAMLCSNKSIVKFSLLGEKSVVDLRVRLVAGKVASGADVGAMLLRANLRTGGECNKADEFKQPNSFR